MMKYILLARERAAHLFKGKPNERTEETGIADKESANGR
jgi:hypothetical protein